MDTKEIETTNCYNQADVEKLIRLILTGKAIVFAGAGFSVGAVSLIGEKLKLSKDLANEIDKLTGKDSDGDLYDASQEAINLGMEIELIDLLKKLFLIKDIEDWHKSILSLPWRRYYTTNYDNVIEFAGSQNGKHIIPVSIEDDKEKLQDDISLHINGHIEMLTENTLNSSFKLTESSYLHQDTLNNSPWIDVFESDIKHASAIVFIGYSIYDYDIKKLLFAHKQYKEKIYFITRDKPCTEIKTEKEYGKVINVGVEGFAKLLEENDSLLQETKNSEYYYESFRKIDLPQEYKDISHDDIRDFLIYGKHDTDYLASAIQFPDRNRYAIIPSWIEECKNLFLNNRYLHITGDLGTGKTVGLKLFSYLLRSQGERVFVLDTSYGDFEGDIQNLIKYNDRTYLFVDNAEENSGILKYIYEINSPKIVCISASRKRLSSEMLNIDEKLINKVQFYNIDEMSKNDMNQLVSIIENIGASASYSTSSLRNKIETKHNNSLPNFLLDFMQSEKIANEIKKLIEELNGLSNRKYQSTIVALCLLGSLNIKPSYSIVQDLSGDTNIRNAELLNNNNFQMFFVNDRNSLEAKSSIFLRYILQNHYLDLIKKEEFLKFSQKADELKQSKNLNDKELNEIYEDIFKKLMQYYTLSKLFTENNFDVILSYFEKLKIEISWLHREPHYWLQLALLNLARHQLSVAKDLIDKARQTAEKKKTKYNFAHIDTTEARYYLEYGLNSSTSASNCFDYFILADDLLKKHEPSDNKYRQIDRYLQIYNKIVHSISDDKLIIFKQRIDYQLKRIYELQDSHYIGIDKLYLVHNSESKLERILHELNGKIK